jgi:outer membrane protein assembly factor BamB
MESTMLLRATFVFALCINSFTAHAQFSMAGGNAQRMNFVDAPAPLTEPKVLWERGLGIQGACATQPIIDEHGNIYVTAAPGGSNERIVEDEKPEGALVSLDRDGNERWRYTWSWTPAKGTTSQLSVPALTPDGGIVMGFRMGWLRCFDRDTGELRWERDLSEDNAPITSAPVVDREGNVYVYVRNKPEFHKLDSKTGAMLWTHRFTDNTNGHASSPSLSIDERTVYIGRMSDTAGFLYAVNTGNGSFNRAWNLESGYDHSYAWSIPTIAKSGNIYLQDEGAARLNSLCADDVSNSPKWVYNRKGTGAPRLLAVSDDAVYTTYTDTHPVVFSLDSDGKERWSVELEVGTGIGGVIATPRSVYFGLEGTGKIIALDKVDGRERWSKFIVGAECSFCEGVAICNNGTILIGSDSKGVATITALFDSKDAK